MLFGGIVSLLVQYPINLLKGEVVSSRYEQRVQPSKSAVDSCRSTSNRYEWFIKHSNDNLVGRLDTEDHLAGLINESKMKDACPTTSESSSGMLDATVLTFLTQNLTLWNESTLKRTKMARWSRGLVFQSIRGSPKTQPMCSLQFCPLSQDGVVS